MNGLRRLVDRMNFADRAYAMWFTSLSVALLLAPRVEHRLRFVFANVIILLVVVVTSWNANRSTAWRVAHDWYPLLLFIVAFETVSRLSLAFVPGWRDASLLRLETTVFSTPPTEWLARFPHPLLAEILEFGYFSFYWILPVVGIVLYGRAWERSDEELRPFRAWMDALAIGYLTCFTAYLLFPTEGPAHTLGGHSAVVSGPFRWLVRLVQQRTGVHGNAFPSAHIMAGTISILAALRWAPRLGRWLILPLLLMCVGAVYDAYHYASDVVAGAALGAAVFAIIVHLLGRREHGVN